jgi:hypothetical protein
VTIGHRAVIHGCTIDDDAVIGMGAVLLSGSRVGAARSSPAGPSCGGLRGPPGSDRGRRPRVIRGEVGPELRSASGRRVELPPPRGAVPERRMISPKDSRRFDALLDERGCTCSSPTSTPTATRSAREVGLGRYSAIAGFEVRIVNQDATPAELRFLEFDGRPPKPTIPPRTTGSLDAADAIVLVDNSAPDRLGRMEAPVRAARRRRFASTITHAGHAVGGQRHRHVGERDRGDRHELIAERGCARPRGGGSALRGLATDTGFFRFNSTSPATFRVAAELFEAGRRPDACYREIYERNSPAYTRFSGTRSRGLSLAASGPSRPSASRSR